MNPESKQTAANLIFIFLGIPVFLLIVSEYITDNFLRIAGNVFIAVLLLLTILLFIWAFWVKTT